MPPPASSPPEPDHNPTHPYPDQIRHTDFDTGVRVLNELIFECRRSLEGIAHQAGPGGAGVGAGERVE